MNKKILLAIAFFFSFFLSYGQTVTITTTGVGTFVVPCGVNSITVRAWGAGGAGGGSTINGVRGDGGGSGGYTTGVFTVTSGQIINYIVGAGGIGSTNNGANGGNTIIADLGLTANGGSGGNRNGGTISGLGGTAAGGAVNTSGTNGSSGGNNNSGNGGTAPNGGDGGDGRSNNNGRDGQAPGGGGGGGERGNGNGSANRSGGDGGNGRIEITYAYYCVPAFNNDIEPITNVTFAGVNKTSTNILNGTPAIESFCDVATVTQGTTYPISIKGNTFGDYTTFITVYVDWNQNGVFENIPNERYDIGIIRNSNGDINSTPLAGNINVPIGALVGNTRMRVIKSFNNNINSYVLPCSSNGWGQAEDYIVTVLPACVLPGNTIATVSAVCANTPFTLSLQNTSASATAYQWQTSLDNILWSNVTPNPFFNTDFASLTANSNVYGAASVTGGELVLTTAVNSQTGGYIIQSTPGVNINSFTASFDYRIFDGNGADGMSLSYGGDIGNGQGGGENGEGTGLILKFDSYDNVSNTTASQIRVFYGGVQIFSNTLNSFNLRNLSYRNVLLSVDGKGLLSLKIGTTTIVSELSLPAGYLSSNKSNWKFKFSARTGGSNDKHSIDNLSITYLNSTFTTSQIVPTYYRSIVSCGGTTNTSIPILVTMDPMPPTLGEVKNLTCILTTGSVVLSGLPTSGTIKQTGFVTKSYPITAATMTISDLAAGDYYFAVNNGTCESVISPIVKIAGLKTTKWDGSVWDNGKPISTNSTNNIIFEANYTSDGNLEGCDCTVNAGVKVTVKSNHALKITNAVKVNTAAGTNLTFQNNASLVQVNDVANSGNIIYERETTPIKRFDYTYWSSPVLNQKLIDVSPETDYDKFYSFDATIDNWKTEDPEGFMQRGIGYIIRAPEGTNAPPSPLSPYLASFVGVPFNGAFTIPGVIQDRSYLLGNPYPSALDGDQFLIANNKVLDGTLYFWTHTTNIGIGVSNPGSGVYAYSSDDYATYNLTGGVGTGIGTGNFIGNSEQTINKPTGKIAAGQAFFTSSQLNPTGTAIVFNNRMRLDASGDVMNNGQFFKIKNDTKKTNTIEKHRVWLNLTNKQGAFKQMLVGYLTGATNGYDSFFDGPSYNGNEFIDFYSISDSEFLAIQGRALPFDENDSVPLGYSSAIEGDFSISIDEVDGLLVGQNIYLEDKLNNSIHNLTKEAYTFETSKGTFDDRFVLRYTDKTLGTGDFDTTNMQVLVSVKNKQIKINSSVESIDKVLIFDILGKQIFSKINVGATELVIPNLGSSEQVLIVKTLLQNGQTVTTKLIY